jgi:hypothetical protein
MEEVSLNIREAVNKRGKNKSFFSEGMHYLRAPYPRDASSQGHIMLGMPHTRDASYKGLIIQGMHHTKNALYKRCISQGRKDQGRNAKSYKTCEMGCYVCFVKK